jgi:putative oxidoreductase
VDRDAALRRRIGAHRGSLASRAALLLGSRGVASPTMIAHQETNTMPISLKALYQRALRLCAKLDWIGPLVVRLIIGVAFFFDGKGKLGNLDMVTGNFEKLDIPFPHANAVFVSVVELVCGLLLVIGLGTRIAALLLTATMLVAFVTAIVPSTEFLDLFSSLELTYMAIFVWLIVSGGGPISIDYLLARRGQAATHTGEPA